MLGKQKGKPPKELVANYNERAKLHNRMGQTILELMRHPDSTLEQLWGARLTYADNYAEFNDMRKQLRAMYWDGGSYFEKYPWNQ